jgi:hypothetical protein
MGDVHMHIDRLEKRTSEKDLAARPSSNKDVSLKNQKRAELLRSRIEELDGHLAMLNCERRFFEKLLDEVRRMDDSRSSNSPTLWQDYRDKSDGCGCCRRAFQAPTGRQNAVRDHRRNEASTNSSITDFDYSLMRILIPEQRC